MNLASTLLQAKWTAGGTQATPCSTCFFAGFQLNAAQNGVAITWIPLFWLLLSTLRLLVCPWRTGRQAFLGARVQQNLEHSLSAQGDQPPRVRGKPRTRYPTLFY